ncbi:MAG: cytochrome C [Proteobacteria bacterium]|nr:cytochrome C [Desulfobulbaceae bacterium]MBU4153017.1 cytochrome C [Pseudomonadota bacterium]
MPTTGFKNTILSIIIGKLIFATKYLCLLAALCLIDNTHCHAADTMDIPESNEPLNQLSLNDCAKCHPGVVASIHSKGMAHRDKLTCTGCHPGHPPHDTGIIPLCNQCHQGAAHFGLTNCLECHTNPHTPMEITLAKTITGPCTTCHNGQLEQLQDYQSIHSTLDCTACHTHHGYLPPCFNCHQSHLEGMANATCMECHKPHMPLEVNYAPDTPSEYCGPCHLEVYSLLGASRAKHRNVKCAECHATKHKTIPECQKCHNTPHSQSILSQFESCGKCHGLAHDLRLNQIDIRLENLAH